MTEIAPLDPSIRMMEPPVPTSIADDHDLAALPRGNMLFEYRIGAVLGQGGFGITYQAEDTLLDEIVAVKEYFPNRMAVRTSDRSARARSKQDAKAFQDGVEAFLTEARIIARFRHPNIMRVRRYFEAHGTGYMVLDFVHGRSLEAALSHGPLPEPMIRTILSGLIDGLGTVHDNAVLHRDLKPRNVILRDDDTPVLIDFGAARDFGSRHSHTVTQIVSPGYSSPEQYGIGEQQGPWSDIYSVGAILYRAVTGTVPVDALRRLRQDPLVPASTAAAGRYDEGLLRLIDAMMAIEPGDRPASAAELASDLAAPLPVPTPLVPSRGSRALTEVPSEVAEAHPVRRGWVLRASVAAAAAAVVLGAGSAWHWHESREPMSASRTGTAEIATASAPASRQVADAPPAPPPARPDPTPSPEPAPTSAVVPPPALPVLTIEAAKPLPPPVPPSPQGLVEPIHVASLAPPLEIDGDEPIGSHWSACARAGFCGAPPSPVAPDGTPTTADDLNWPDLQDYQAWNALLTYGVEVLPAEASAPLDTFEHLPVPANMQVSDTATDRGQFQSGRVSWMPVSAGLFDPAPDQDDAADDNDDDTASAASTPEPRAPHRISHPAAPRKTHLAGNEALSRRTARHNPCHPVRVGGWRYTGTLVNRTQPTLASMLGLAPASPWQPGCVYGRPSWSGR